MMKLSRYLSNDCFYASDFTREMAGETCIPDSLY